MRVFALHLRETGNIGWRDNFVCIPPPVKFFFLIILPVI